MVYYSELY